MADDYFREAMTKALCNIQGHYKNAIIDTVSDAGKIIENLLNLAFLYVGVFIIQVIALPIIVFWMLVKLANSLFEKNVPVVLRHSRVSGNEKVQINNAIGVKE